MVTQVGAATEETSEGLRKIKFIILQVLETEGKATRERHQSGQEAEDGAGGKSAQERES